MRIDLIACRLGQGPGMGLAKQEAHSWREKLLLISKASNSEALAFDLDKAGNLVRIGVGGFGEVHLTESWMMQALRMSCHGSSCWQAIDSSL